MNGLPASGSIRPSSALTRYGARRRFYRRTGNLRAVQLLLGHSKIESTLPWHRSRRCDRDRGEDRYLTAGSPPRADLDGDDQGRRPQSDRWLQFGRCGRSVHVSDGSETRNRLAATLAAVQRQADISSDRVPNADHSTTHFRFWDESALPSRGECALDLVEPQRVDANSTIKYLASLLKTGRYQLHRKGYLSTPQVTFCSIRTNSWPLRVILRDGRPHEIVERSNMTHHISN